MADTDIDASTQRTPARKRAKGDVAGAQLKAVTKSGTVIKLLLRSRGATPLEMIATTDWQPHTIRAFLSGLRKKGQILVREARKSGEAAYRIEVASALSTSAGQAPLLDAEAA
jgi:hypothetical protein